IESLHMLQCDEQRERWERQRSRTARELVQTEQRYCQQLELVTTVFKSTNFFFFFLFCRSLLVHLENGYFGKGLDQFCSHLHHYNMYVDNIYNATKVLGIQLKKNKAFRRFKKLQEARPEFNDHKLEDLLQLPIHRIDHIYTCVITQKELNQSVSKQKMLFVCVIAVGAVTAVSKVSCRIQDNARRHENHLQLCRVQKLLKGRKTKVLAAGRWYIREGWLKVVPQKGSEAKPKMFFLLSDMLLEAKHCSPLHPTNGDKFAGQQAYPLQDCTVEKVFGHTRSQGGLLSVSGSQLLVSYSCDNFLWKTLQGSCVILCDIIFDCA
uniref:Rho guanine nucleotide exchange factor 39 n=1 Tax=Stegastes partitus TaxID=144197 RepID=A0A3B4ZS66_9TELE